MLLETLFAILAGILTVASPCVLPLLPILLSVSIGQRNPYRPLFIVLGFIVSFAGLSLLFGLATSALGLTQNQLHNAAIVLLALFGVLLIWPKPFELLTARLNGIMNRATDFGDRAEAGARSAFLGAFIMGLTLGIVWTPCAGPVLGSILALIATTNNLGHAGVLLAAYALGAGIPMLVIAYGGQYVTTRVRGITRYTHRLQQIFGVLLILLAVAFYYQYDTVIESWFAGFFPSNLPTPELTQ
jgi:cytochrome c biogenesis protein CcdA